MPKLCRTRLSVSLPFSVPMHHDRPAAEPAEAADHRRSSAKARSPASGVKSVISACDVVEEMRPVGMARDLGLLPGVSLA
jgi:hypothetical protein